MAALIPLTDKEKYECTVRWLNRMWRSLLEQTEMEDPCEECPVRHEKCDRYNQCEIVDNFAILERHTGENTVVKLCLNAECL